MWKLWKEVYTVMVNNDYNINKANNQLSPSLIYLRSKKHQHCMMTQNTYRPTAKWTSLEITKA